MTNRWATTRPSTVARSPALSTALALGLYALSIMPGRCKPLIDNGIETSAFPQVVALSMNGKIFCTGTAVGPNTVLTAAHCLPLCEFLGSELGTNVPNIAVEMEGVPHAVTGCLAQPAYNSREMSLYESALARLAPWSRLDDQQRAAARSTASNYLAKNASDLGLVTIGKKARFPNHVPVKLFPDASAQAGLDVTLAGYGGNDRTAIFFNGTGKKRTGTNTIDVAAHGLLFTTGRAVDRFYYLFGLLSRPDGKNVGTDRGDSGGPMLYQGALIGVNVAGFDRSFAGGPAAMDVAGLPPLPSGPIGWDIAVSLSHPSNVEFLRRAVSRGYEIDFEVPSAPPAEAPPKKPTSETLEALRNGWPP